MRLKARIKKAAVCAAAILTIGTMTAVPSVAAVNNDNQFPVDTNSWVGWPQAPDILSGTGVLMDADSGQILFNKGMDDQRFPASITKIMTTLLAIENTSPDQQVTFTETGLADAYDGVSNIHPQLGETFTMEQCIYMMMLKSANDVATQVAETVGGSVPAFVDMMNQKAQELGCTNTHFNNANGLPDENHYTTARDMALITQAAFKNETFRKVVATQKYEVPATAVSGVRDYDNHHQMMLQGTRWTYAGCLGGKTGYTDSAQSTLATYSQRNGLNLIAVVLHGAGDDAVYMDTISLMDYGFNNFKPKDGGGLTTADNKVIFEDQVLTQEEYDQKMAPKPDEETEEAADADTESNSGDGDSTSASGQDDSKEQEQPVIKKADMSAYIVIAVLGVLVISGIIAIIVTLRKRKKD